MRVLRTCGDTLRGEITLADVRVRGEFLVYVFRGSVGELLERTDVFFLIDRGSVPGPPAPLEAGLGVESMFPVGKRGSRFELCFGEVIALARDGVEGCDMLIGVLSGGSMSGISEGNNMGLLGGKGEGGRGPRGRRSAECCEVEREW